MGIPAHNRAVATLMCVSTNLYNFLIAHERSEYVRPSPSCAAHPLAPLWTKGAPIANPQKNARSMKHMKTCVENTFCMPATDRTSTALQNRYGRVAVES